ncbi:winged helix-turn-helix domain-containing tetratricopeptide repeat protein [Glacieibacterium megasporae]|uniref:winged helix-turn-helix domain-containing tetratricopeptide repeat protein n=1 Tax=Glacieibacterium megasporae TaxID=2835787 RepID=UPI001C1E237D|nr:winged helix-turn-helix domain-containing protein [Polymorphobacter megasporae]UAJ08885.1 winged helix-turn-helix domain-containing protein [Polymorphobacter megasporae]
MPVADQIDLARAPAFRLGPVTVAPALRQITAARSETLEPRVMQVLVVLALAEGAIVSRDDLVRQCWEGRIVGDDSINRVIARLRKLAIEHGGGTLRIETITKVGYRLIGPFARLAPCAPAAATLRPAARPRRRPTLAVLALDNRSGETADGDLANNLVDDIISALSVGRGLRIITRSATAGFRDGTTDIRAIGADLDADFIVHGHVRGGGDTVRVTTQLIDVANGAILWAEKFDLSRSTSVDAQDQLVAQISGSLCVQIQRIEIDRAQKKHGDITPFEAVQRSWACIPKFTPEGLAQSIADARKAVAIAPGYALAVSTLAVALGVRYQRAGSREPEVLAEALQHADRALTLGENHGTVLFHVALVKSYAQKWKQALELAERSVELNPNMPEARQTLGGSYTRDERYDEALAQFDDADRLAPRGLYMSISLTNRCWALFGAGRLEEALAVADRVLVIMPSDRTGLMQRIVIAAELGRLERAREDMTELRRVSPGVSRDIFLGTIRASRQADHVRDRDAALFNQVWRDTPDCSSS